MLKRAWLAFALAAVLAQGCHQHRGCCHHHRRPLLGHGLHGPKHRKLVPAGACCHAEVSAYAPAPLPGPPPLAQ